MKGDRPARRRVRFTCAVCGRRRGFTKLAGFAGKFRPKCTDCAERLAGVNEATTEDTGHGSRNGI